jgi:hypothetical protein
VIAEVGKRMNPLCDDSYIAGLKAFILIRTNASAFLQTTSAPAVTQRKLFR